MDTDAVDAIAQSVTRDGIVQIFGVRWIDCKDTLFTKILPLFLLQNSSMIFCKSALDSVVMLNKLTRKRKRHTWHEINLLSRISSFVVLTGKSSSSIPFSVIIMVVNVSILPAVPTYFMSFLVEKTAKVGQLENIRLLQRLNYHI